MMNPTKLNDLELNEDVVLLSDNFEEEERIDFLLKQSKIDFSNKDIQRDLAMSIFEETHLYSVY